jgi:hypothetical protein
MGPPELVIYVAAGAGLAVAIALIIGHACDAMLRLVAGITAIIVRDKRPRADRALDVLRLLRRDREPLHGSEPDR